MKKIMSILATLGLVSMPMAIITTTPATAQVVTATCEAQSPFASGVGVSYDPRAACRIALRECSMRTPAGAVCVVTNWYWN